MRGRWGGLECWAGVGRKGRKLYLNNNLKKSKKFSEVCLHLSVTLPPSKVAWSSFRVL